MQETEEKQKKAALEAEEKIEALKAEQDKAMVIRSESCGCGLVNQIIEIDEVNGVTEGNLYQVIRNDGKREISNVKFKKIERVNGCVVYFILQMTKRMVRTIQIFQ